MLDMALNSDLPLITVHTDDTVNVGDTLSEISGTTFHRVEPEKIKEIFSGRGYPTRYVIEPDSLNWHTVYESCVEHGVTLVVVNPPEYSPVPFNAGWMKPSQSQLRAMLNEVALDESIPDLMNAFSGLSLKDVGEIMKIVVTQYQEITVDRVLHLRRLVNRNTKGLSEIETENESYIPSDFLLDWLAVDGKLLMDPGTPRELTPRGLLFDGEPGTGKTEGAKWLAHELGIPLYRLDLGSLMNKYVGESEQNLERLLGIVDKSDPCILLFDEVEKVFKMSDDSGVTSRLLSQLLWWLQDHSSRVLSVMTTNDKGALPPELIRPWRIDQTWVFKGILRLHAGIFLKEVYEASLEERLGIQLQNSDYKKIVAGLYDAETTRVSHSNLVQALYGCLKQTMVAGE